MILVTGGTGLVGAHLLYQLCLKGAPVRATYRNPKRCAETQKLFRIYGDVNDCLFNDIEWVEADLLDIPKLEEAFFGITKVYHCAAFISFDPRDYHQLRKTNIEGTANIVNLCIAYPVKKLCHVSSIAAVGQPENEMVWTEESPWNPEADNSVYAITKYGAEMEVWRGSQEGLDVIIVNPGVILGEGFWKYGSGALFKIVHQGLKYYTHGTVGFVDVQDVVQVMIKLMDGNIINQRYILTAGNCSFREFFGRMAYHLKVPAPRKELKPWQLSTGWRLDWLRQKFTGKRRRLTKQTAYGLISDSKYVADKIKKDLDYHFTSLEETIERVSRQFLKNPE